VQFAVSFVPELTTPRRTRSLGALLLKPGVKDGYGSRPVVPNHPDRSRGRPRVCHLRHLIVTVLIGQVGNFAGMSQLQPPANVTALLRCGELAIAVPGAMARTRVSGPTEPL
jgi:hypothetical protein